MERINNLRARFAESGIDTFLLTDIAKIRYLTGFNGDEAACFITQDHCYLIVDSRFREQAKLTAPESEIIVAGNASAVFKEKRLMENCRLIGIDKDMDLESYFQMRRIFQGDLRICDLIGQISEIKEQEEIEQIEKALRITEYVFEQKILPLIRPGISENDLAAEVAYWGRKCGAEKESFEPIIASGVRSSLPHARPTSKLLEKGDMVQFDFGYVVNGYCSDFSRVVFLGRLTQKQREIYAIVLTSQELAISAAKPGMKCGDLDAIARNHIKLYGYDMPHSLGHGLGIMIHSNPVIGPKKPGELKPGNVITIEPGIYLEGWGGIRLEDVILITEQGRRNLTKFSREMMLVIN